MIFTKDVGGSHPTGVGGGGGDDATLGAVMKEISMVLTLIVGRVV